MDNRGWRPVGYSLMNDDHMIIEMFKSEHPGLQGSLKIHPRDKDGFRKLEFKSNDC